MRARYGCMHVSVGEKSGLSDVGLPSTKVQAGMVKWG